jgi:hypothetical protein
MRIFIITELREITASSGIFDKQFVGVAPHPFLARLGGDDHGMIRPMKVFGHVFVPGIVTTERDPAGLAGAQVDPVAADLDTFFANEFLCQF